MSKAPEHFRPFDMAQAKAGAPIGCRGGFSVVQIVKFDAKKARYPVIGVVDYGAEGEVGISWSAEGFHVNSDAAHHLDLVMLPLGMCEGKPVFVGDMLEWAHMGRREPVLATPEMRDMDDLTWPRPEPEYPETSYSETELACICHGNGTKKPSLTDVANSAIARACKDGDVVPSAMLDAIANAVRTELVAHVECYSTGCATYINDATDIAAIIKRVKDGKL